MAYLLSNTKIITSKITGTKSDKSDQKMETITVFQIKVADDLNIVHTFEFDHDPADNEIIAMIPVYKELIKT